MSKSVTRLYKQFRPNNYRLELKPDRATMSFTGKVVISGHKVDRPSHRLTFHQKGLKITSAKIIKKDRKGDEEISVRRVNRHASYDEVRLHTEQQLYPGQYQVTLEFAGQITHLMNGIYPCFFGDKGSKQLIATQFESHHAREVFPGIDEPEAKATFDLTLTTPVKEEVVANTPVKKQTVDGDLVTTTFETTPKMSSYLLAFVYGEMSYKEAKTKDGTKIRAYTTPDNVGYTDFALDVAVKCLEFYNDYFDIPYPLPKCDLIALPDFASGAMENWGCITFREACMLVDPKNTSLAIKQYVAMVIAHELAHQWFGNLVTMRWWTDLWLNEGFASWIEYLAIDHIFPEWQMWTQFVTDEQQIAMRLDALENTHPIEVAIHHPDEIRSIFDTISYNKGSSVIHMLHEYLGKTAFRDGLRHYLKTHAYENTDTVDLWRALEEVSGQPVRHFMHSWTSRPGFPLVRVTIDGDSVNADQQRFYANPEQKRDVTAHWPVAVKAPSELEPAILDVHSHAWSLHDQPEIFKFNSGQSGFYRCIYDPQHLEKLGQAVANGQLSATDRLGILADSFESAKAGYISTLDALKLLSNYRNEDNNAVWDVMASGLGAIRATMDDEELRQSMNPFIRKIVARQMKRLGWETKPKESYFDSLLRPTVLGLAAIAEDPVVVKECQRRFEAMKKIDDIPADLRGVVYSTAARNGSASTLNKLVRLYKQTTMSDEKVTLASALASFRQPELIEKVLAMINTDNVRHQDVSYWVAYNFANRYGRKATWSWFTKHWDWLHENLGNDLSFDRFPLYAARSFSDRSFLKTYQKFFKPRITPGLRRTYHQGVETIEWQADWKQRDLEDIKNYFSGS